MVTSSLLIGVIGAGIGVVGSLGAVSLRHWLQTRRQRTSLRKALLAEIESTNWITDGELATLTEELKSRDITHSYFPTSVYDENIGQIGLLEDDELNHVIQYYSTAYVASQQIRDIYEGSGDINTFVEGTLDTLITHRNSATDSLKENL